MTDHFNNTQAQQPGELQQDDSDADAFAVLSLLLIITAAVAFYLRT